MSVLIVPAVVFVGSILVIAFMLLFVVLTGEICHRVGLSDDQVYLVSMLSVVVSGATVLALVVSIVASL